MPAITIATPFNYSIGETATHYKKGEQDVPQAVADHAARHGYLAKPKAAVPTRAPNGPAHDPLTA